ncbi:MFS transporter [Marinomonas mediterranea]|uniref:MFS transporter n=2 Tax=Marinomonas mediterranea TaxID=119864 RepID=UPI00234B722C|nr:MFS transporter [Marinomonas mediterranea]WCN07808.1 MFS transporter [Marinomonas mediterranea]
MLKHIFAQSVVSYFLFAFIAMVGTSYINFLPSVVSALAGGIGFSDAQAGEIVAANGYGALLGSIGAIFLVRKVEWKPAMYLCLLLLAGMDIGSVWIADFQLMMVWRFIAGLFGGLCMGIAFSVLARLNSPDRAFGTLLFIQFSLGAVVIALLPSLQAGMNDYAVFYVMALLALISLVFMFVVPNLNSQQKSEQAVAPLSDNKQHRWLLMLAIMLYNCAASGIWAYAELIGLNAGMQHSNVTTYLASTSLLGLLGAILPIITANQFGRLFWIIGGGLLSLVSCLILIPAQLSDTMYISAMALLFFSWTAVVSYMLAVTAELDCSGQLATIASVVSLAGSASGPMVAANFLTEGDFSPMLWASAGIFLSSILLLIKPVSHQEMVRKLSLVAR